MLGMCRTIVESLLPLTSQHALECAQSRAQPFHHQQPLFLEPREVALSIGELHTGLTDHFPRLEFGFLDNEVGLTLSAALHILCKRLSRYECIGERHLGALQFGQLLLEKYDFFALDRTLAVQFFNGLGDFLKEASALFLVVAPEARLEDHL